jgi:2-polyprenyl-6-hydroxyphenyl methylase/3-demethylubiquinone-9 3-methyltransferase
MSATASATHARQDNRPVAADGIAAAVEALGRLVITQRAGDERYFAHQLPRYQRTLRRLQSLRPAPCRVLDIGSHYLHQSVLLSELGHEVCGIDVPLFAQTPFVQERARAFGVRNESVDALADGDFLPGDEGRYGLIVFTEILEHITFNPVRFWQRVHALLAPGGIVYLSTPNALRPAAWVRQLGRLLAFRGIGIGLEEILGSVTYGHHWKEYSAWELHRYFALLSPDFSVETHWYSTDIDAGTGWRRAAKALLATVPCWRSDIEAVVHCRHAAGFVATAPELPMQTATAGRTPMAVP